MRTTRRTALGAFTFLGLGGLLSYPLAFANGGRADCPGTIVCPASGEVVCKDQCPLTDATRADCPGKIECPETGEPVCIDQCPLPDAQAADVKPSCCRNEK